VVERLTDAAPSQRSTLRGGSLRFPPQVAAREAEVRSADDFIEQVASSSTTTGRPYLVRFSDGREIPCSVFLRTELSRLRKQEQRMDGP
jgi:hypothetical protein